DVFDEIRYRVLVGRVADAIDDALDDDVVANRLIRSSPGWRLRGAKYAHGDRRSSIRDRIARTQYAGAGAFHVRNFYASGVLEILGAELLNCGCGARGVNDLVTWMKEWRDVWSVPGLPVGPEGSTVLANAMLTGLDAVLRELVEDFVRYVDDVTVFLK